MSLILADVDLQSVYIAGPMRGYPEYNFPAFFAAEAWLRSEYDVEVYNPARKDHEIGFRPDGLLGTDEELDAAGFDLAAAMEWDTQRIIHDADAVILLDGWQRSNGARMEFFLARALRKPTYELYLGEFWEIADEL